MLTTVPMMCFAESETELLICCEPTAVQLEAPSVIFAINDRVLAASAVLYLVPTYLLQGSTLGITRCNTQHRTR